MHVPRFDRRITIQQPTQTADLAGGIVNTWATFLECWAGKVDKSGTEALQNARDTATRLTEWWIRYDSDYTPTEKMRVNHDSRNYDIEVVTEIDRKKYYKLTTISEDGN